MNTAAQASPLPAFEVNIEDMRCIAFAETPAKARWKAVRAYWDAGYGRKGVWPRPTASRRPIFDGHAASVANPNRVFTESYL